MDPADLADVVRTAFEDAGTVEVEQHYLHHDQALDTIVELSGTAIAVRIDDDPAGETVVWYKRRPKAR